MPETTIPEVQPETTATVETPVVTPAPEQTAETETAPETSTEEATPTEKPRNDTVPLAKYLEVQKKAKEYERKLAAEAADRERAKLEQSFIGRGYPETEARLLAEERIEVRRELEQARRDRMEGQVERLARSEEFYADADTFKDELLDIMREKNVDAKQAYLLHRGDLRLKELQTKTEQRNLAQRKDATNKKVATAAPAPVESDYSGLNNEDKRVLAELQRMQPDAGWNAEKFKKMRKGG
jgi:hypothetical protein